MGQLQLEQTGLMSKPIAGTRVLHWICICVWTSLPPFYRNSCLLETAKVIWWHCSLAGNVNLFLTGWRTIWRPADKRDKVLRGLEGKPLQKRPSHMENHALPRVYMICCQLLLLRSEERRASAHWGTIRCQTAWTCLPDLDRTFLPWVSP